MGTLNKSLSILFMLVISISSLIIAANAQFGSAQNSGTNVSGIISVDTTWTKANSPYSLSGNVMIDNGVTLTILPGVTVYVYNYYIMVNGSLQARGSSTENIIFNSGGGQIIFTPYSNSWNEETHFGSIISGAILTSPITIIDSSPMISDSNISYMNNPISISGGSPVISGNNIYGFEYGDRYGRLQLTDIGILISNNNSAMITDNVISGFSKACISIEGGSPTIQRNVIEFSYGVDLSLTTFDYVTPTIQNNTFAFCRDAILTGIDTSALTLTVLYNNFENTTEYNIYWAYGKDLNVANNWWGITDAQAINQTIYDFKNDFNLGRVTFIPILTAVNPQAPTLALKVAPSSTPAPTATAIPSPSSSVPELPWLIVVPLSLSTLLIGFMIRRKKKYRGNV